MPSDDNGPTATSAAAQALRIPELLETILLSLPQKDALLSQRVSTAFRDTVRHSSRLQKALFFQPDWTLEGRAFDAYAARNRPGRKPENNRLLLRAFPGCYPTITLGITSAGAGAGDDAEVHPAPSPDASSSPAGDVPSDPNHWSWDLCISFPADAPPASRTAAVHRPEASWRRMFLSQPPCTALHLVLRRWQQRAAEPAVARPGGITMGDFEHEATKAKGGWRRSYIGSDRDWHFEGNIKCSSIAG